MISAHTKNRWWRSLRNLIAFACLSALLVSYTATHLQPASAAPMDVGYQSAGVIVASPNHVQLDLDTALPPVSQGAYSHYGLYMSAHTLLNPPGSRVTVQYAAHAPTGSASLLDVRASSDGQNWTIWETNVINGSTVDFPLTARLVQYRVRFLSNGAAAPALGAVQIATAAGQSPQAQQAASHNGVAPTFRLRGTRQGMIGGRTANGHIIRPRDRFVSLPSWRSLSSRGGHEYQVRISYNGRSAVAPVWDVGPWNTDDDYWDVPREVHNDLPQGWPQDHAAYYHGHNGGFAKYGYVRFPTAIDVGDGVWWDDLGIRGDQAEVEVTFLWLGHDPHAANLPAGDPAAAEYTVDELGPFFSRNPATWERSPVGCGKIHHAFWTLTMNDQEPQTHQAFWQPNLPTTGLYDVYVHVPICPGAEPRTTQARYLVQHQDGAQEVIVDQAEQTHWVKLGRFPFAAGDAGFVQLTNLSDAPGQSIWFDSARWVPVREE